MHLHMNDTIVVDYDIFDIRVNASQKGCDEGSRVWTITTYLYQVDLICTSYLKVDLKFKCLN
jgi:hypothetical protein